MDPKTNFSGGQMVHIFILYAVILITSASSFQDKLEAWEHTPTPTPDLAASWPCPDFICVSHHTVFTLAFCLPPAAYQAHSHLRIHRYILNKISHFFSVCVCVSFPAPPKKGKKRKAQREEEQPDKTRRTLTSKEARVLVLSITQCRVERGSPFSYNSHFMKLML